MKRLFAVLLFAVTASLCAQAPPPPPQPAPEPKTIQVDPITKIALKALQEKFVEIQSEMSAVNQEVSRRYPGYHLDPMNPFNGILYENPAPAPKPAAAPKPAPPPAVKPAPKK